jgi:hypothetical protein
MKGIAEALSRSERRANVSGLIAEGKPRVDAMKLISMQHHNRRQPQQKPTDYGAHRAGLAQGKIVLWARRRGRGGDGRQGFRLHQAKFPI